MPIDVHASNDDAEDLIEIDNAGSPSHQVLIRPGERL
jgi:hypothetical protein